MGTIGFIVAGVLLGAVIYLVQANKSAEAKIRSEYESKIAELEAQLAAKETGQVVQGNVNEKAYAVLCDSYTKILKVNLTEDNFEIIKSLAEELDDSKGFSRSITIWLREFAQAGMVHKEDVNTYLKETDGEFLKKYFRHGMKSWSVTYRRKVKDVYQRVKMEIIRAEDYTDTNQQVYLYVKDME